MRDDDKPGVFYLGKKVNPGNGKLTDQPLLYDSKDLTTHAVCVGMTGSGKTGLGIALIEEAALDKIPSIIIDPKGDLSNLLLMFPDLSPEEFAPWVEGTESAQSVSKTWKEGLEAWGEDAARIRKLRASVDIAVYTPASKAGIPISILSSFSPPSKVQMLDAGAIRERIQALSSSLLGLLGINADPIKSRENILLSTLFQNAWQEGNSLDIAGLIQQVQKPPFAKIGALDVDTFFPPKERIDLSISLNNLLASPGYQAWMEGVPLDIQQLLYGNHGKPRLSVISIAHLSDAERMFFVTLLLNEFLSWMRRQSGTSALRALLYMDEIFGFFPPTASPPSKLPMLTLLKQARAFGIGIVLATQNPVDLDYKGLANCGTWFIGKLQTDRDKSRLVEGLKAATQGDVDDKLLDKMFALTGKRTFIMRSVHEKDPVLFQTRWTLSYLRGPLTLAQIATLKTNFDVPIVEEVAPKVVAKDKPTLPPGIEELFEKGTGHFVARLVGFAKLHFVDSKYKVDVWQEVTLVSKDGKWDGATSEQNLKQRLVDKSEGGADFEELPAPFMQQKNYATFAKDLSTALYQNETLVLYQATDPNMISKPGESEQDFRSRVLQERGQGKSGVIQKIEEKYAPKIASLNDKLQRAQSKVEEKQQKAWTQKLQTMVSFGTTILGAVFGKKITKGTISDAGTALRRAGRIGKDSEDATQAESSAQSIQDQLKDLKEAKDAEIAKAAGGGDIVLEEITVRPRKSDIFIEKVVLAWLKQ
jgi:hypothetical protein